MSAYKDVQRIVDRETVDKFIEILKNIDVTGCKPEFSFQDENDGFISKCLCHTMHPEDCPLHGYFMK